MTHYSVQPKDIFKNGFLSFAKNMSRNIGRNIGKNLSSKYSLLDYAADAPKNVSKRAIQKKAEATGTLIGNEI